VLVPDEQLFRQDVPMEIGAVRFFFDPVCPWTWITSRWLVEVAEARHISIQWETFSLRHRNRDNPNYDWLRAELDAQHPSMRVIEATRYHHGNDAVGRLYTALGTLIHHDDDALLARLDEAIALAGLPPEIIDAGREAVWDEGIAASTEMGRQLVGDDAGIPLIVIPGNPAVLFGPVLSPAPTGQKALELWDLFVGLGRFDGLFEIKRSRTVRPQFGPRPG
jgi:2-hydroxychromene-2-carboxylate isomerase